MDYVFEFDFCALILISLVYWILHQQKNFPTETNRIFRALLSIAWLSTAFDLIGIYTLSIVEIIPLWFNYVIQEIYLLTFNSCAILYYVYVISMTKEHRMITNVRRFMVAFPACIVYLLLLTSPFTHWVFYFDENLVYSHGFGFYILYVIGFYYILMSLIDTIKYTKLLTRAQKAAVFCYSGFCLGGLAIQIIFPYLMVMGFAISLSALLVYLSLQNPDDFMDKFTGTFNKKAFMQMLTSQFHQRSSFTILCLEINDFKYINQTLGVSAADHIIKTVAKLLQEIADNNQIYHLSGVRFAVIMRHMNPELDNQISKIQQHFQSAYQLQGAMVSLTPLISVIHVPEHAKYVDDVIDAMEFSISRSRQNIMNPPLIYAGDDSLLHKRREAAINHVLRRAIQNNEFTIVYQPIFSIHEQCYTSAEALIRLTDPALGPINPSEFIPIAERNGTILAIEQIFFDRVCHFIFEHELWNTNIRKINVNLSTVQCMQGNLSEQLLETINKYKIPADMFNFEITETAALHTQKQFAPNMKQMMDAKSVFSLDNYDIDNTNGSRLVMLPFRQVKLSKETIWSSMDDEKSRIALKHTVSMFRDLSLDVVAVGVETKEQAEILTLFGCNYLQGYFYQKPLTEDELLSILH